MEISRPYIVFEIQILNHLELWCIVYALRIDQWIFQSKVWRHFWNLYFSIYKFKSLIEKRVFRMDVCLTENLKNCHSDSWTFGIHKIWTIFHKTGGFLLPLNHQNFGHCSRQLFSKLFWKIFSIFCVAQIKYSIV